MHLITISGANRTGGVVTYVLGQDRNKVATVFGIAIEGDGTVIEKAEFLEAKVKRYFERGLTSMSMRFSTGRQFASPALAVDFARKHRREVPVQGNVVWEVQTASGTTRSQMTQAICLIHRRVPIGLRVETDYELIFGDFDDAR